jgi:hypothetical protein
MRGAILPASRYQPSTRLYHGLDELEYPAHDRTALVTICGRLCYQRRKINVSQVFAGQKVGVKQTEDHLWLVTGMKCYPCPRNGPVKKMAPRAGLEPATLRLTESCRSYLLLALRGCSSGGRLLLPGVRQQIVHKLITVATPLT